MKRIMSLLLVIMVFGMILAGCGSADNSSQTQSTESKAATAQDTTKAESSEQASAEPITLNVAISCPDFPDAAQQLLDSFTAENPNIKIDFVQIPGSIQEFFQPKAASGDMPDFMSIDAGEYGGKLADEGLVADLKDTEAWKNTIDSLKPTYTSSKGISFGIPGGLATSMIYYNKKMFKDAGITDIPTNWDDFLACCDKIKNAGNTPIIITPDVTFGNTVFSWGFAENVIPKNADWKKKIADGSFDFNTPEIADIFQKAKLLMDKGYTQKGLISTDYATGNNMFVQGQAAMHFAGIWLVGTLTKADFEVGMFLPPWNAKGQEIVPVIGTETGFGVGEKSKNKAEAIKLLEFWMKDGYSIYQNARMNVPHMKSTEGLSLKLAPQFTEILPQIQKSQVSAQMWFEYLPSTLVQLIPKLEQEVLVGKKNSQVAAKTLDENYKDALKK